MKYVILALLSVAMLLSVSCDKGKINELNGTIDSLRTENARLTEENQSVMEFLNEANKLIESVSTNLDSIAKMETDLEKMPQGQTGKSAAAMKDKLNAIGQYLVNSKEKIANLEKQLSSAKFDIKGLKMLVTDLKNKLQDKETEVLNLMEEKGVMQADIDNMGAELKNKDEQIAKQESVINEAHKRYYTYGSQADLQKKGIIQKTGGFLFFGKVTKLSPNLNLDDFTAIDGATDFEIDIPGKMSKIKIISPQPSDSYQLVANGDQTTIKILDPITFWAASKVLVVTI